MLHFYHVTYVAGELDYSSIHQQQFTFSPDVLEAVITINITDDFLFEYDEVFMISMVLISEHFPGLILGISDVNVTILDNDGMYRYKYVESIAYAKSVPV